VRNKGARFPFVEPVCVCVCVRARACVRVCMAGYRLEQEFAIDTFFVNKSAASIADTIYPGVCIIPPPPAPGSSHARTRTHLHTDGICTLVRGTESERDAHTHIERDTHT
jgi:hypothetical protein